MRKKNTLKNMTTALLSNFVSILIGLIAQAIFIKLLGNEYLGLNSLFSNIISMLSIAELGFGIAIIYNLFKPIAEDDIPTIKSLIDFYKKSYHIICIIISIIGLAIIPLLKYIVNLNDISINVNIYLIYILFLADTIMSYLISYKRSILYANQKNYIINIIHMSYLILLNVSQIIILLITHNYYIYLIVKIITRLIENLIVTHTANKLYHYLKEKNENKLDKSLEKNIFKRVKGTIFHKIGGFIVLGTDNIIISKFLGLISVGLYSNYYLIINSVQNIFNQVIQSSTASVGNLLVTSTKEKQFDIFKKIRFLNFWIATFSGISILVIMDSFITIWIGKEYILPKLALIILVINHYFHNTKQAYYVFKDAAGIQYEDRYVPIIESIVNIIASIVLVKFLGLAGVFLGTIMSSMVLWCFSFPKFIYTNLFNRKISKYFLETIGYFALFTAITIITYTIANSITIQNIYLSFIFNVTLCAILPNLILLFIFRKSDNFKYYLNMLLRK